MIFIYDKTGRAVAHIQNRVFFSIQGEPLAFLDMTKNIYNYKGMHIGRFEFGWVRDLQGYCIAFTDKCSGGGPILPILKITPIPNIPQIPPIPPIPEIPKIPGIPQLSWSSLSWKQFFGQ